MGNRSSRRRGHYLPDLSWMNCGSRAPTVNTKLPRLKLAVRSSRRELLLSRRTSDLRKLGEGRTFTARRSFHEELTLLPRVSELRIRPCQPNLGW
jgi:hypothetical protein